MARIDVNGYKTYFGGKSGNGTYQTIINHIPPHEVFCSLFLGNCGVARRIRPAKINILNDLDVELIISWESAMTAETDRYILSSFNAIGLLTMAGEDVPAVIAQNSYKAHIAENSDTISVGDQTSHKSVMSPGVISVIAKNIDTPATFIYLDPPYLIESRKSKVPVYKYEMTRIDHELLLAAALKLKHARVMISAYPNGLYDELLTGWHTVDFYSNIRNGMALERLYMNYEIGDRLHDYSYIGSTFREREKHTRIKNNMLEKLQRIDPRLRNSILTDLAKYFDLF